MLCVSVPVFQPLSALWSNIQVTVRKCLPSMMSLQRSGTHRKRCRRERLAQWILHQSEVVDWDQPVARWSMRTSLLWLAPVASAVVIACPRRPTLDPMSKSTWNVIALMWMSRRGSFLPAVAAAQRRSSAHSDSHRHSPRFESVRGCPVWSECQVPCNLICLWWRWFCHRRHREFPQSCKC